MTDAGEDCTEARPEEHRELEARRERLLARRAEVQSLLDARVARDDGLLAECEQRAERRRRNLERFALHEAASRLLRIETAHEAVRHVDLRLQRFGCADEVRTPPRQIPPDLIDRFTLGGRIPVFDRFHDNTYPGNHPLVYTDAEIDCYLDRISHREYYNYGTLDYCLWEAFRKYSVSGLQLAIMGSRTPWFEAACLKFGAHPTTIDYNPILARTARIRTMTTAEWERDRPRFDGAVSISSFEHDGLGAYGDPIDPDGDLKAMRRMKDIIKPGGLMFFNVPLGPDRLNWNRSRVYGPLRLPMLLGGWTWIDSFGMEPQYLTGAADGEPLLVLRNDAGKESP